MHITKTRGEAFADGAGSGSQHAELLEWIASIVALARPAAVRWCDGSQAEWNELTEMLVRQGTLVRLNPAKRPNSFYARSDEQDVARVESRTFICCEHSDDAGPTNNWRDPADTRAVLDGLFDGCMTGRTLYVVPFCMGALRAADSVIGVQLTDSAYVVLSMRIMVRMGQPALDMLGSDGFFVRCVHSVGVPLVEGEVDVAWPCNDEKWIVHYPEQREIWSFGSGYGGNALLGKKCMALRIASVMARDEGWLAEHMLVLKVMAPDGRAHYMAAAFPSACGKTNMAMLESTLPGWRVETIGDDICWMRVGADGRLWAVNPEAGFFGVAPGTGPRTNRNAVNMLYANSLFTNTALTADGDVWWQGLTDETPDGLSDWRGAPWDPAEGAPMHANARFTVPAAQCPVMAPEWLAPQGVPISAILFGGRRATTVPLVTEAFSWQHGVYLGANIASEGTAAAENAVGALRRDPFAMLPFCGYHMADYFAHWLNVPSLPGALPDKLPGIYMVNWFRTDASGKFVWPGFGDNIRVLEWIVGRLEGEAGARDTAIGRVPTRDALDLDGLSLDEARLDLLLGVDTAAWQLEADANRQHLAQFGDRLPEALRAQQQLLEQRLDD